MVAVSSHQPVRQHELGRQALHVLLGALQIGAEVSHVHHHEQRRVGVLGRRRIDIVAQLGVVALLFDDSVSARRQTRRVLPQSAVAHRLCNALGDARSRPVHEQGKGV